MAKQQVDIGTEGNDGTGDSIRESFKKVNENFEELYAVFGIGGQIGFVDLTDTPNTLLGNETKIPVVNPAGNAIELRSLTSNGSVAFSFDQDGEVVISVASSNVELDTSPTLGGPLDGGGFAIGNIDVSEDAVTLLNGIHGANFTIDDLAINKRYADATYEPKLTIGGLRLADEPTTVSQYTIAVDTITVGAGDLRGDLTVTAHGLADNYTGSGWVFSSTGDMPTFLNSTTGAGGTLTQGAVYFIGVKDENTLTVHPTQNDAQTGGTRYILTTGTGTLTLVDQDYDATLPGNWLKSVAIPRKSAVRRQGDSMDGALFLSDHPGSFKGVGIPNGQDDLQAATKLYVDQLSGESQVNIYVSEQGDDLQKNTPNGKEGSSLQLAFRSVNAACRKAEEIMIAAPREPGPYMQTITYNNFENAATVLNAGMQSPVADRADARVLLEKNKLFLQKEVIAYTDAQFPAFNYDRARCELDVGLILDSIGLDILRGNTANFLSRQAGLRYYSTSSGKRAVGEQLIQTVAAMQYLKQLVTQYIVNNVAVPLPTQSRVDQVIDTNYEPDNLAVAAISDKFDVILAIVQNGVFSAPQIIDGSTDYKINIDQGTSSRVDQADPTNTDIIPGKLIRGKTSGALGRIIDYVREEDAGNSDPFDFALVELYEPIDFLPDEELEYGNQVQEKQISIIIESGIYDEDYPIRVPPNVSIVGNEFRRSIIRPKDRVSQSPLADLFYYRDNEFDGLVIGISNIGTIGTFVNDGADASRTPGTYTVDSTLYTTLGYGADAIFTVVVAPDGAATVTVTDSGKNWRVGDTISIPDSALGGGGGALLSFNVATVDNGVPYVNPLTGNTDGYFGRHYLRNPAATKNVGPGFTNIGNWNTYATVFTDNKEFIKEQVDAYLQDQHFTAVNGNYVRADFKSLIGNMVDLIAQDLVRGGLEFTLEAQGLLFENSTTYTGIETEISDALDHIPTMFDNIWIGQNPTELYDSARIYQNADVFYGDITPDLWETDVKYEAYEVIRFYEGGNFNWYSANTSHRSGPAFDATEKNQYWTQVETPFTIIQNMIDSIKFAFNAAYNPAKNNKDMDVFLMNDGTILRNITVKEHGGFMGVLDPEGQVLTRSPYIQTGSSFSASVNKQAFRGGLFVDAFSGNMAVQVTGKVTGDAFRLNIQSLPGQGLFIRRPQTPSAFYIQGRRFQVNAITAYDQSLGTATIILDPSSNSGIGFSGITSAINGIDLDNATPGTPIAITLQTAGNRSMLGNDFTQINDLGYGLVCVNGALSEMVSMFTYYCWTSYYSKNGSEIRSITGSSCYGEYGLVAEGADPNEVPDRVSLVEDMVDPAKVFTAELILHMPTGVSVSAGDAVTSANPGVSAEVAISTNGLYVYLTNVVGVFTTTDAVSVSGTPIGTPADIDSVGYNNREEALSIYTYDFKTPPDARAEFDLYHTNLGRMERYSVNSIERVSTHIINSTPYIGQSTTPNVQTQTDGGTASGTNAMFTVLKNVTNGYEVIITTAGTGYAVGETFTIVGTKLGGATPLNDATITVSEIDAGAVGGIGSITGVTISGAFAGDSLTPIYNNYIYKLNLSSGNSGSTTSGFSSEGLAEAVPLDTFIEYRRNSIHILDDLTNIQTLTIRPSTAIVFDENKDQVYRSISFQNSNSAGDELESDEVAAGIDTVFDYIRLQINNTYAAEPIGNVTGLNNQPLTGGTTKGNSVDDVVLAVEAPTDVKDINRLNNNARTPTENRPVGWTADTLTAEAPIFTYQGTKFYVFNYRGVGDDGAGNDIVQTLDNVVNPNNLYGIVDILPVGHDINTTHAGSGLPASIVLNPGYTIRAGLAAGALGDVTVNISTCRATGHDFLDVGTGSYNTSNYPNVIFGAPREPDQSNEVIERGKGRVFYVSTDQNGMFRVGRFFSVDQGTGAVSFEASIALSNVDGLGFKRGVVIAEFSTDSSMADNATDAVPTESAVRGYVDRRFGIDVEGQTVPNPLGPSILLANGANQMTGDLRMNGQMVTGLTFPEADTDATRKSYVDAVAGAIDSLNDLTDTTIYDAQETQFLVASGKQKIGVKGITGGLFELGQTITGGTSGATGLVIDFATESDVKLGTVQYLTYDSTNAFEFVEDEVISVVAGPSATTINFPEYEWMNGIFDAGSDIDFSATRNTSQSGGNPTGRSLTLDVQYKAGSIVNSDVNASAAIAQSKLAMNAATTRTDATGIGQNDLGLVAFHNTQFTLTNGWAEIATASNATTGVEKANLAHIETENVLGRATAATGAVEEVSFNTVVNTGGGILHTDIPDADTGAVIRTGTEAYDITGITTSAANDSIVKTTADGSVHVKKLIVGTNTTQIILDTDNTDITFKTPAQGTIFTARGAAGAEVARITADLDIIGDGTAGQDFVVESSLKTNSTYGTAKALASRWNYMSFIEAPDEKNAYSTGISIGAGTGKTAAGQVGVVVSNQSGGRSDVPAIFSSYGQEPDADASTASAGYNIGSTSFKYNTMYARNFVADINFVGNLTGDVMGDVYAITDDGLATTKIVETGTYTGTTHNGDATFAGTADKADNADNVEIDVVNDNTDYQITFVNAASNPNDPSYSRLKIDDDNTHLTYNPDSGNLTTTTVTANLTGNVTGNLTGNVTGNISGNLKSSNGTNIIDTGNDGTATELKVDIRTREIVPEGSGTSSATYNIGASSNTYNTGYIDFIQGIANEAYYADLAENYTADTHYEPGTVVIFGGEKELTLTTRNSDHRVAGVVSTNPAYLMNSHCESEFVAAVALQGRVPCNVIGKVEKGDILVTSDIPGFAVVNNDANAGRIIGKSLENKTNESEGIIEIVVGKH